MNNIYVDNCQQPLGYVYKTTNIVNGKIYIGQHKYTHQDKYDKYYIGAGKKLKTAIKEFGRKNFKREILQECYSQQQLDEMEQHYIKIYKADDENVGYNILNGGISGFKMIMSEESRKKMALTNKMKPKEQHPMYGKHLTKEWKENLSKSLKGRKKSDEQKQKISQKLKGIKRSEETRKKIGQAQVGKKLSEETKMKISLAMKKRRQRIERGE